MPGGYGGGREEGVVGGEGGEGASGREVLAGDQVIQSQECACCRGVDDEAFGLVLEALEFGGELATGVSGFVQSGEPRLLLSLVGGVECGGGLIDQVLVPLQFLLGGQFFVGEMAGSVQDFQGVREVGLQCVVAGGGVFEFGEEAGLEAGFRGGVGLAERLEIMGVVEGLPVFGRAALEAFFEVGIAEDEEDLIGSDPFIFGDEDAFQDRVGGCMDVQLFDGGAEDATCACGDIQLDPWKQDQDEGEGGEDGWEERCGVPGVFDGEGFEGRAGVGVGRGLGMHGGSGFRVVGVRCGCVLGGGAGSSGWRRPM